MKMLGVLCSSVHTSQKWGWIGGGGGGGMASQRSEGGGGGLDGALSEQGQSHNFY